MRAFFSAMHRWTSNTEGVAFSGLVTLSIVFFSGLALNDREVALALSKIIVASLFFSVIFSLLLIQDWEKFCSIFFYCLYFSLGGVWAGSFFFPLPSMYFPALLTTSFWLMGGLWEMRKGEEETLFDQVAS